MVSVFATPPSLGRSTIPGLRREEGGGGEGEREGGREGGGGGREGGRERRQTDRQKRGRYRRAKDSREENQE